MRMRHECPVCGDPWSEIAKTLPVPDVFICWCTAKFLWDGATFEILERPPGVKKRVTQRQECPACNEVWTDMETLPVPTVLVCSCNAEFVWDGKGLKTYIEGPVPVKASPN
jgi:hypothetical protein